MSEIKKLNDYSKWLDILAKSNSTQVFPNKDHRHAAIAISKILKYSRNSFFLYDDNLSGDISTHNEIESLDSSLIEFISRGGKVKIVIGDKSSKGETSDFENDLSILSTVFSDQIEVKLASDQFKSQVKDIYGNHINFTIGDNNKFRLEHIDTERKASAECSFNNREIVREISSVFNSVYNTCLPYFN